VLLEEAEHTAGLVSKCVSVFAGFQVAVGAAEVDAAAAVDALRVEVFAQVVPQHRQRLEVDLVAIAQPVAILGGKVAVYAAPNAVAFGIYPDRFRHLDPAIGHDANIAVEFENALVRRRR